MAKVINAQNKIFLKFQLICFSTIIYFFTNNNIDISSILYNYNIFFMHSLNKKCTKLLVKNETLLKYSFDLLGTLKIFL